MSNQNITYSDSSLAESLIQLSEFCLDKSKALGASASELSISQGEGMSVSVRNGETETIEYNRDKSMAVTVYFGNHAGSANTTDLTEKALSETIAAACNIAKYTEEDPYNGLAEKSHLATEFPDLDLYHPWEIEMDQAIELASQCEQAALEFDKRITNSEGGGFSSHQGLDIYANSLGFKGLSSGTRHSYSCSVVASSDNGMQRDYWYDSCRHPDELMPPEEVGLKAAERTVKRLDARKLETGNYPVIFENGVSASLLSHFVSAIGGTSLYRKASFLLDHKGQQIFPEYVHIHEQPHLMRGAGSASFDSEGVATQNRDLVKDGILSDYVLSSYSARKLGLETTGNAGGVRNLTIDSTVSGGLPELVKQMDRGVIVTELIGYGVNIVTGDYSRGAFGYWVENGEIQYPVQEFTVAGNLKNIFLQLQGVADDVNYHRGTLAGSMLIESMTVAGT